MADVRAQSGAPTTVAPFTGLSTPSMCAPLVVDSATGWIYSLKTGDVVVSAGMGGTVTSVAMTVPTAVLAIAGSPITTAGTLAVTLATQVKNTVWAGPTSGADATPTFRVITLASADFVNQGTATTVLHGNAAGNPSFGAVSLTADVTGTLPVANGGTGYSVRPAFLAYNSASDTNQTGNGAIATIGFDTEVFDVGGDFASNTFTAPVTGNYSLNACALMTNLSTAATFFKLRIVTSNRTYAYETGLNIAAAATECGGTLSVLADMDASDTATVTVQITGMAGDTAAVFGGATLFTFFSGHLAA